MRVGIAAGLLLAFTVGCGFEDIDPATLDVSIDGYENWDVLELTGTVPGHGNTIRLLYRNDVAQGYTGGGEYPVGTALVKEIYSNDGGEPGTLKYTAIMRRITVNGADPGDLPLDEGWLFTDLRGGTETYKPLCWDSCHRQAPYQGAYLDHGL